MDSPLICSIIDAEGGIGKPAARIAIVLMLSVDNENNIIATGGRCRDTDEEGQCKTLLPPTYQLQSGVTYRIAFQTGLYYQHHHPLQSQLTCHVHPRLKCDEILEDEYDDLPPPGFSSQMKKQQKENDKYQSMRPIYPFIEVVFSKDFSIDRIQVDIRMTKTEYHVKITHQP